MQVYLDILVDILVKFYALHKIIQILIAIKYKNGTLNLK